MGTQSEEPQAARPVPPCSNTGVNPRYRVHRGKGLQPGRHSRSLPAPDIAPRVGACAWCESLSPGQVWLRKAGHPDGPYGARILLCDECARGLEFYPNGAYSYGGTYEKP